MKKKHMKKILQNQLQEQADREIAINTWIVANMPLAAPKWIQKFFHKAILGKWNRTLELIIWLYSLEIRFAKDGQRVINVAIFRKGEMVDSWQKPEDNVIDINSVRRNGREKEIVSAN